MASRDHGLLWLLFLAGFLLRAWGLADQPALDDEVAAAFSAHNYVGSGLLGQVMWYHPPLRDLVVYLSGQTAGGYTAWGLRGGSLLLGCLTVPLLGYLGYALFRSRLAAFLAAFFLCLDPLHITFSREAFQETTTTFFVVSGALAAVHGIRRDSLLLSSTAGLLFGLAASSKWHGLFPWFVSAAAYLAAPWLDRGYAGERDLRRRSLMTFAAYGALPAAVYVAVYLPWILRGYSFPEFVQFQLWLVKNQYFYKGTDYDETFLPRRALAWFLWPVGWPDFVKYEGKAYLSVAMGNFLVWGLTLPSLVHAAKRWLRSRDGSALLAISWFVVSYVPLLLTTRSIWVMAATAVIPFAFLLTASAIASLRESSRLPRYALALYLAAVCIVTGLMYPLSTFRALDHPYLQPVIELYRHDVAPTN